MIRALVLSALVALPFGLFAAKAIANAAATVHQAEAFRLN